MKVNKLTLNHNRNKAYGGLSDSKQEIGEAEYVEIPKPHPDMKIIADGEFTTVKSDHPFTVELVEEEASGGRYKYVTVKP